jgi:two-component system sensor histidine kinase/response regulator
LLDTRPQVLVVDDEARNRSLLVGYLGSTCRVLEAEDVPGALAALAAESVDLVLLDVMLPGTDGFEGCRLIKAQCGDPYLPVVLVTALGEQEMRNRGLEAGADDFLTKPVDRRELQLRVGRFLRLREQDRTIRRQLAELRQLDGLKDDLVAMLVHDLRNPLTGLVSMLECVASELRDPELVQDLDLAREGAARVREAVEDVLATRHLEESRIPVERAPVVPSALIGRVIRSFEATARQRSIQLRSVCATDAPCPIDEELVRRAVENLVANAIRYSPRAGVVEIGARTAEGGIEIFVSDAGPGVPEALKPQVFDKFVSTEPRTGSRRGFGYGLYLVRLVAEAHGGRVSIRDLQPKGSEFVLWVPTGQG